jgi:site-specific DNA-methyltransferase (cytosine-N4-specific)
LWLEGLEREDTEFVPANDRIGVRAEPASGGVFAPLGLGSDSFLKPSVVVRERLRELTDSVVFQGDARVVLPLLPSDSVQVCCCSPPYWSLRDYVTSGQIGLEPSVDQFINRLVQVFSEVKRVLKPNGVLWLNVGDVYTSGDRGYRAPDKKNPVRAMSYRPDTPDGLKPKDLIGIPWRLAFALQRDGWYLRSDIIWHKTNCMPESVKDRPTKAHEYLFLLSKSERYYYDYQSMRENNGRNRRTVWSIPTQPFKGAHFATFPPALIEPLVRSTSRPGDFVLDPFLGSGTTALVAGQLGRKYVGVEINPDYVKISLARLRSVFEEARLALADGGP